MRISGLAENVWRAFGCRNPNLPREGRVHEHRCPFGKIDGAAKWNNTHLNQCLLFLNQTFKDTYEHESCVAS